MLLTDFTTSIILKDHFRMGSLVKFHDNSYVTDKWGKQGLPTFDAELGIFKIIDHNKPFPTDNFLIPECAPINSLKVQNICSGKIYHCSKLNIVSYEEEYPSVTLINVK